MQPLPDDYTKPCLKCKIVKHKREYTKNRTYKDGLNGPCKICQRKSERKTRILRLYGITEDVYNVIARHQNFVCAICKRPSTSKKTGLAVKLAVDHNHETGKIRGLLCLGCNISLGHLVDKKTLIAAVEYLGRSGE